MYLLADTVACVVAILVPARVPASGCDCGLGVLLPACKILNFVRSARNVVNARVENQRIHSN